MILGRRRYRASVPFRRFGVDPVDTVDAPKCLSDVGFRRQILYAGPAKKIAILAPEPTGANLAASHDSGSVPGKQLVLVMYDPTRPL